MYRGGYFLNLFQHIGYQDRKRHFPEAGYKVMQGSPEALIVEYLKNRKQNEVLVLGA